MPIKYPVIRKMSRIGGIIQKLKTLFWKIFIYCRWIFSSRAKKGTGIGDFVPDFTLSDLGGRKVALSSFYPNKAVILWLTNLCSSCEERISILNEAYERSRDQLEIIAISTLGDDRETPARILKNHKVDFPLLLDPEDWIGKVLGFEHPQGACPLYNLLILDHVGQIKFRHHLSAISDEKFFEALKVIGVN